MITLDEIRTALRQVRHDHHAFAVAERETWEEIGVRVTPHQRVGPLPMRPIERNARRDSLTLWPFVCHVGAAEQAQATARLPHEVASVFWVPVR